jgi:DNA helicase II / ATP-dependent DNA helicase PcrA
MPMSFYADLHLHSKFSRATSRDGDLEHLALAARTKGLTVIGTGDFTHPAWRAEIEAKLKPAEPGLLRLIPSLEADLGRNLAPSLRGELRFMLTVEISTIYKKDGATRKVHHLIVVPDLAAARKLVKALLKIGNLASDGRPILGLDSRDLLEITLAAGEGSYLIPAHIWTPWFSSLGSKSGFDTIADCYGDLAPQIFAAETGLSSDPPMNWMVSALDRYRLVSNSDAHSPGKLGREACAFTTALDYYAMREALVTGAGYAGTVEFFPEEGKYHLDGHRACGVRLTPEETRARGGRCPKCGKPVTVGVMSRVAELADRPEGARPASAGPFKSLIPLTEVIGEVLGRGAMTRGVMDSYQALTEKLGPELYILEAAPLEDVRLASSDPLAEALRRMRSGRVIRDAGYDGEYGTIKLFAPGELRGRGSAGLLFELPEADKLPDERCAPDPAPAETAPAKAKKTGGAKKKVRPDAGAEKVEVAEAGPAPAGAGLDDEQASAAAVGRGALMIVAGPGAGKTRTLTHRIARLIREERVPPEQWLAITFTRRAAAEMRERLDGLLGPAAEAVAVMTFHGLGYTIISEQAARLGLSKRVRVIGEMEREEIIQSGAGEIARGPKPIGAKRARQTAAEISRCKRAGRRPEGDEEIAGAYEAYERRRRALGVVDFDDLIGLTVDLLEAEAGVLEQYRRRWRWVAVDEYQDLDELQYRLIKLLCPPGGNLCVIGDPDQAIYGFRGGDVSFFLRFREDYPDARAITLHRNYRSGRAIVEASGQMIAPATLAEDREAAAVLAGPPKIAIHETPTDRAEAEFVVHAIERMVGGATFFSMDSGRVESGEGGDYGFGDFAVLYRLESQAELLVEALARSGIPFQQRSHRRLAEGPAVAEVLEAMRAERAGGDVAAALREAAERLTNGCAPCAGEGIRAPQDSERGPEDSDECADEDLGSVDYEAAREALMPLAERCGDDWTRFFAEAALGSEIDSWDPRAERVSLLTLHAAKGLEFRAVFIVGVEDGLIPLTWGGQCERPDEERRLLFVGMTRARERLILTHARRRLWRGKVRDRAPSPFLAAIEERLLLRERSGLKPREKRSEQLELF